MGLRLFSALFIFSISITDYSATAAQAKTSSADPATCPEQPPKVEMVQRVKRQIRHNNYLYETGQPTEITDSEYDGLVLYLRQVMNCFPELSVTPELFGSKKPERTPIKHFAPMLSLKKAQGADQVKAYLERFKQNKIVLQPKFDGIAVEIRYRGGLLLNAATRGDGTYGTDITPLLQQVPGLPKQIDDKRIWVVRGELVSTLSCFAQRGGEYSSARQMVAALAMQHQPASTLISCLNFVPYAVLHPEIASESEAMLRIGQLGFYLMSELTYEVEDLREITKSMEALHTRRQLDFPLDGIVLKVDSKARQKSLGATQKAPRWALAWKFDQPEAITRIREIEWRQGRTGRITPRLNLDPITLNKRRIVHVSGHSHKWLEDQGAGEGALVALHLKGDSIPQIKRVISRSDSISEVPVFSNKPLCLANAAGCEERFALQLEYSAKAIGLNGAGPATVEGWISKRSISALSLLFQPAMIEKYPQLAAVDLSDSCELLAMLGVPRLSQQKRLAFCQKVPDSEQLLHLAVEHALPKTVLSEGYLRGVREVVLLPEVESLIRLSLRSD